MDKKTRKELKKEYQQTHPPMGVYQIRNIVNNKILIGAALNLPGVFNGSRAQLNAGSHMNRALQADWREYGSDKFVFEILDELKATEGPASDYKEDLAFLEEIWLEKEQPYGDRGYNQRKKGTEERLRLIAQNRSNRES